MQKAEKKSEIKQRKYMNLLNDWGFKYVFGKEKNLIHFLNLVFRGKEEIRSVNYLPCEQLGKTEKDRKAIFDVYCKNEKDEPVLLEMQNLSQTYFRERSLFYSTFLIQNQSIKGDWDFKMKSVYIIGILNFVPKGKTDESYIERISLINEQTQKPASNILNLIYIVLPKFKKTRRELKDDLDYWLYILKHSREAQSYPETIKENTFFRELLESIKLEQLKGKSMKAYRNSELRYEDLHNFTSFAEEEGEKRGEKRGIIKGEKRGIIKGFNESKYQISGKLLELGMSISDISKVTGLSPQQIKKRN
jgi:predicted transposase/invertase (TIGR01784 family)